MQRLGCILGQARAARQCGDRRRTLLCLGCRSKLFFLLVGQLLIALPGFALLLDGNRLGGLEILVADQRRIENLPINGRNYINFTLTDSQAQRDSAPSIGAAPGVGMEHLAMQEALNGSVADWMEHVNDEQYGAKAG